MGYPSDPAISDSTTDTFNPLPNDTDKYNIRQQMAWSNITEDVVRPWQIPNAPWVVRSRREAVSVYCCINPGAGD